MGGTTTGIDDALDLVMYFEGCMNRAYACPAHVSRGGRWPHLTIGYGHTGPEVKSDAVITTRDAGALLARDMGGSIQAARNLTNGKVSLADHQLGAFASLIFNCGLSRIERSQTWAEMQAGNFGTFNIADVLRNPLGPELTGMTREWAEFRLGGGKILRGLARRRAAELQLFHTGVWDVPMEHLMPRVVEAPSKAREENAFAWRPGMRSDGVVALHEALSEVGYPTTCDDTYTFLTAEAVKQFQMANGMMGTGVYDKATATKLAAVVEQSQKGVWS